MTSGKVPAEDENGVPSSDERFQVKVGKTLDHLGWPSAPRDSAARGAGGEHQWAATAGARGSVATG